MPPATRKRRTKAAHKYELSLLEGAAMNKKTKALTTEQYKEIIQTMREGFSGCRPNERIATALVLEGNLGLRISDILKLPTVNPHIPFQNIHRVHKGEPGRL